MAAAPVAGRRWRRRTASIIGRGKSGAANIRTDLTGARASIVEAARLAFLDAGRDPGLMSQTPAVLGLAGSNVGTYRQQLEAILPFRSNVVTSDALIALEGAVGDGDGAIAVLGTGSAYHGAQGRRAASRSAAGASWSATRAAAPASAATCWKRRCSPMTESPRRRT